MDILNYILTSALISVPFVFAGILIDRFLSQKGLIRSDKWIVTFSAVFFVLVKPFLFASLSWWIYSIMILIGLTFLAHRFDLRESAKRGSYWWKQEEREQKRRKKKKSV